MSKAWSEKNKVTRPQDYKNKEESYAAYNANGTGPYMLVKREPDVRTTYKRNPNWWASRGQRAGGDLHPIKQDATRVAALISGEIDLFDPPPRTWSGCASGQVKVLDGMENRVVFIGMDQGRDELLYSSVKGRNPFRTCACARRCTRRSTSRRSRPS